LSDVARELEGLRASRGLREHLKSTWNKIDFIALLFTGTILGAQAVVYACQDDSAADGLSATGLTAFDVVRNITALAYPFVFARLLYFFQGNEQSGVLVRMIIGIVAGINTFMIILLLVVAGFGLGFLTIFRQSRTLADDGSWIDVHWAFYSSYQLMLGGFDNRQFDGHAILVLLFLVFTYIINIVMLNLLIALMGDLYDAVQETAYAQYLSSKAQLVLEAQAALLRYKIDSKRKQLLFPMWLQLLVPRQKEAGSKAWSGKVAAVKNDVGALKKMVQTLRTTLTAQQKESDTHRKEVKEQLGRLEEMMTQLAHTQKQLAAAAQSGAGGS